MLLFPQPALLDEFDPTKGDGPSRGANVREQCGEDDGGLRFL